MADTGESQALSILSSPIFSESPCLWVAGWNWKEIYRLICIFSLSLTCIFAFLFNRKGCRSSLDKGKPPLAPHRAPLLGHLLAFFRDPASLCLFSSKYFGEAVPCFLDLFWREMYLISGPSNINLLWKNSHTFTPKAVQILGMRNILKLGSSGARFCELDDSGRGPRPHPLSNVKIENRIWFLTHDSAATYLFGPHLKSLASSFQHHFRSRVNGFQFPHGWILNTDLYTFLYDVMFPTQIEVLFGTSFLTLNPKFPGDFRVFHQGLAYLLRGYPRWMVPKAWDARERCLTSIKKWHVYVQEQQADETTLCHEDRTLRYGSRFISVRREMHSKMKALDADDIASSDLGVIWAANSNIITATCWYILELAKDPELLSRVRAEATTSMTQSDSPTSALNIERLCVQPLIQSGYAEVLRLHTYNFLVTTSEHSEFMFRGWRFPKDQMVAFSSHTAHMDNRVWNVRSRTAEHPLNTFWAGRFLIHESDPCSGPLSPEYCSSLKAKNSSDQGEAGIERTRYSRTISPQPKSFKFSLAGLNGIWAPFGGGYSLCPGRHLAKEEILVAVANTIIAFDFKLVEQRTWWKCLTSSIGKTDEVGYQHDMRYFGMGVLPPKKKVEVMIRRRI